MSHPGPHSDDDLSAPVALRRLMTGYRVSQAIYVAARLGLADRLGGAAKSADELAHETGAHAPSLARLLRALAAFGVLRQLERDDAAPERFALTPLGAALRADAPNSARDIVLGMGSAHFWQTWGDLLHCVETGESANSHLFGSPNAFDLYARDPELGARMNATFAATGRLLTRGVLAAYAFAATGVVVDVGGGRGQLLAAILNAHPALRGVLIDLPQVAPEAQAFLEAAGVAERCAVVGGDIFVEVPRGGTIYLLSRIIHDWDDARALTILRACHRAMDPGATLLLVDVVLPGRIDSSPLSQHAVLQDLNMLVRTGGRERAEDEYRALLVAAGYALEAVIPTEAGENIIKAARLDEAADGTAGA